VSALALLAGAVIALSHSPAAQPARVLRGPHDKPIPILMYHVVTAPPAGAAYPELWLPWRSFVQQVLALRAAGYHGVTLKQAWDYWHKGYALPRKPIVLSFDDGYLSQYTHARSTLAAVGWPGVLNLIVDNIDRGGLTRHQVRAMLADGWELDSHTITHADVSTLDAAGLRREIGASRTDLRRIFHVPVDFFCYPAGKHDAAAEAAVRAAGYLGATTEGPGVASPRDDPDLLPRIRVNGTDTAASLLARIHALGA
jgi:peptidoglycan/xylan/chitin deacetylase (PgdA/CDA1 family)